MTPQEMWNAYKKINPSIGDEIDPWAFGVEADLLADLVLKGEKRATASPHVSCLTTPDISSNSSRVVSCADDSSSFEILSSPFFMISYLKRAYSKAKSLSLLELKRISNIPFKKRLGQKS